MVESASSTLAPHGKEKTKKADATGPLAFTNFAPEETPIQMRSRHEEIQAAIIMSKVGVGRRVAI